MKKTITFFFFILSLNIFSQEIKSIESISASPNPFFNTTKITFKSKKDQNISLIVKNILGKTVYKEQFYSEEGANKIIFNRQNLKQGMYIYTIQNNENMISKRFVIK